MTTKKDEPMNNPWLWLLDLLKKQGLSFLLLGFAVWYFYGEVQRLEAKSDLCQTRIINIQEQVIFKNTRAMEDMNWYLEELRRKQ